MVEVAEVRLWGTTLGAVAWNPDRGYATFEFAADYARTPWDVAPLTMPKSETGRLFEFPRLNPETFKGLPGLLADALPDRFGSALLDAWLAREGRVPEAINPVERLCYTGKRAMGALEFEPAQTRFHLRDERVDIENLVELAGALLEKRSRFTTNLHKDTAISMENIIQVGTSAGGARAKAVVAYNPQTGETRSGQLDLPPEFKHYILKLDGVNNKTLGDPEGYGRIEYAYYRMARAAGIEMTESRLLEEGDRAHFMTERFDRVEGKKRHMQTLCALAHFDYNLPDSYAYEQAFQVMRSLRLPYTAAEELFRRMVFNVMAVNNDDHTKNISFLMDQEGHWSLAPAYDVTYAYHPANPWLRQHQMSVNGKRNNIAEEDFKAVARAMNIKKPDKILLQVKNALHHWERWAAEAGMPPEQTISIGKLHYK